VHTTSSKRLCLFTGEVQVVVLVVVDGVCLEEKAEAAGAASSKSMREKAKAALAEAASSKSMEKKAKAALAEATQ